MKKVKSLIIIVLILAAAFLYAHIGKNNLVYDKNVDNSQYIPTGAVAEIEQTFVSQEMCIRDRGTVVYMHRKQR